jgi:amidase
MVKLFEKYEVLACPTVGCMPHLQSEEWVDNVGGVKLSGYMDWLRFAFLATTAGLPSISVPVGLGPRGLPVGLQLIGKPRGEAELLSAARLVELTVGGPLDPIDPIQFRPNDF